MFLANRLKLTVGVVLVIGLSMVACLSPSPSPSPLPPEASRTPTAQSGPRPTETAAPKVYLPDIAKDASGEAPTPIQPTSTPAPTQPPTPTPTPRPPMRLTKLGLGIYDNGGALLPALEEARPSVLLLIDPDLNFAKEVRRRFPKAFIVGRIFAQPQPLDNPRARGAAFADLVAEKAVPLAAPLDGIEGGRPVIDAWMSYNEVTNAADLGSLQAWNDFQVAFAERLQGHYGIPAVAGNDATNSIPPEYYAQYMAEAIRVSKYFGVHVYPPPHIKSLLDPTAADLAFEYRRIHQALEQVGVTKSEPYMIITELGLWHGWKGVVSDVEMGRDFICYAEAINQDSYMLGAIVYGLFSSDRWAEFNVHHSAILRLMGDYNTEGFGDPKC